MRDVCDLAETLILEEMRAMVLCDRQAAFAAVVAGADMPIPSWHEERDKFLDALNAQPSLEPVDVERRALRRALGLPDRVGA